LCPPSPKRLSGHLQLQLHFRHHCVAGACLAQDWDYPDELAAAIATRYDDPAPGEIGLDNLIRVSWRLRDAAI
jgi:HD-like signal output (HDOD) protein